jgi:polysaccharide biosynthesis protein PelC
MILRPLLRLLPLALAASCASGHRYHDVNMDFGVVKTVAVVPFTNLSRDTQAADRVRDVFSSLLLSTGSIYVLPHGEVLRAISRSGVGAHPPSSEDVMKLGKALAADAVITGTIKEYGELRSGNSMANVISVSVQMQETATGRVVWSASTTRGGIGVWERLLGGGGEPMNLITEAAVHDLLAKLFK